MTDIKKNTVTLTGNISVDFTFIARNLETFEENLKELEEVSKTDEFKTLSVKNQVMSQIVLEAYHEEGLEGGVRELIRFNMRNIINALLREEVATDERNATIRVAPCRLKLDVAQKVLNAKA